jgi:hypothetical protein
MSLAAQAHRKWHPASGNNVSVAKGKLALGNTAITPGGGTIRR